MIVDINGNSCKCIFLLFSLKWKKKGLLLGDLQSGSFPAELQWVIRRRLFLLLLFTLQWALKWDSSNFQAVIECSINLFIACSQFDLLSGLEIESHFQCSQNRVCIHLLSMQAQSMSTLSLPNAPSPQIKWPTLKINTLKSANSTDQRRTPALWTTLSEHRSRVRTVGGAQVADCYSILDDMVKEMNDRLHRAEEALDLQICMVWNKKNFKTLGPTKITRVAFWITRRMLKKLQPKKRTTRFSWGREL